jgi:putative inorganic carbon (HCO3(-)) transporter
LASIRGLPLRFQPRFAGPAAQWRSGGPSAVVVPAGLAAAGLALGVLAGVSPKLAIGAAVGLGFAGLVISNITAGLCFFIVLSFLEVLSSSYGITKMVGFLLVLSWLAVVTTSDDAENDFVSAHPGITYLLAVFVGWSVASSIWAESASAAVNYSFRYAQNALLFLIVFSAIRNRKHARWAVGSFVIGATVAAIFAILNPPHPGLYDVARASGTIGDPNELAAVLVAGLILAGVLISLLRDSPTLRLAVVGAAVLCAAGLFSTFSRGGLVSLGCALLAAIVVGGRWRRAAVMVTVVSVLSAVMFFAVLAPKQATERVTKVDGGTGRTDIWRVGARMVDAHPIRGVGAGNFQVSSVHYAIKPGAIKYDYFIEAPKVAHNTYLQVLAELGFVGLVPFLMLLGFAFACVFKAAQVFARVGDRDMELVARGVLLALIGILSADLFISGQFSKQLWLLLGLCPALLAIARRSSEPAPSQVARSV